MICLDCGRSNATMVAYRKQWDFFVSYAREDQERVADPLAEELTSRGFAVWQDHRVGVVATSDSKDLASQIQSGLTECHAAIVILSPHFVRKDWPMREVDSLLTLEAIDQRHKVVPILHELSATDVPRMLSPSFRARLKITTAVGVSKLCDDVLLTLLKSAEYTEQERLAQIAVSEFPRFSAPGVFRCANANCSWRVPLDWPSDMQGAGPEFTLARLHQQWCIVCAACGHPVGSVTEDEAKDIATRIRVGPLWAPKR